MTSGTTDFDVPGLVNPEKFVCDQILSRYNTIYITEFQQYGGQNKYTNEFACLQILFLGSTNRNFFINPFTSCKTNKLIITLAINTLHADGRYISHVSTRGIKCSVCIYLPGSHI